MIAAKATYAASRSLEMIKRKALLITRQTRHRLLLATTFCLAAVVMPHVEAEDHSDLQNAVGQKIIVGFFGTKPTDPGFRQVLSNLENGFVGGVLFLGRNISTVSDLDDMVHELTRCTCAKVPIIAVDEEGGVIERLGANLGLENTPSAAEIGSRDDDFAEVAYSRLAQKLAGFGFNLDLAPVVDLNVEQANPIIGRLDRSYSPSPEVVVAKASILIRELRKQGIASSLKHFPGHGSSLTDSHDGLVDVEKTWSEKELIPYKSLISSNLADSVMVGHLSNLDRWGGAATQYGSTAVSEILRRELRFEGLAISDDIAMAGARLPNVELAETIRSSIRTGLDAVIVSRASDEDEGFDTGKFVNDAIVTGVLTGEIDRGDIYASSNRIALFKSKIVETNHNKLRSN